MHTTLAAVTDIATRRQPAAFDPTKLPRTVAAISPGKTYRAKLTRETVEALPLPTAGLYVVKATDVKGLELRVTKLSRTFYMRARMGGREDGNNKAKPVRVGTLADFGDIRELLARADAIRGEVRSTGRDFNAEHHVARAEYKRTTQTVASYFETYKTKPHPSGNGTLRPRTLTTHFKALGFLCGELFNGTIDALTPARVVDLYAACKAKHGVCTARNGLKALRAVQNFCELPNTTGPAFKKYPCARAKNPKRPARISIHRAPELAAWLVSYRALHPARSMKHQHANMMLLALLTGLRDRTLKLLHWDWMDMDNGVMTIPGWALKVDTGEPTELPLSPRAVELLRTIRAAAPKAIYVFTSTKNEAKPMARTADFFADLPWQFSAHDCRKAFCSILGNSAVQYHVVKALMTHTMGDVTGGVYLKVHMATMKEAVLKVDAHLWG